MASHAFKIGSWYLLGVLSKFLMNSPSRFFYMEVPPGEGGGG